MAPHEFGRIVGAVIGIETAALSAALARDMGVQILDQQRHAMEWSLG